MEAKQHRSQLTQQKIIDSLYAKLQKKYFEQITIAELAEASEISVGAFYRRFKDKQALLPLLYEEFGQQLKDWIGLLEATKHDDLDIAIRYFTRALFSFINIQSGVFRTLHTHARLQQQGLSAKLLKARVPEYQRIQLWLSQQDKSGQVIEQQMDLAVFIAINSTIDKVLYPDLTPAIATSLEGQMFSDELATMLLAYLKSTNV